jgi:hypothetical protein
LTRWTAPPPRPQSNAWMRSRIGSVFVIVPIGRRLRCLLGRGGQETRIMTTAAALPASVERWMAGLIDLFSPRTRQQVLVLVAGAVLAPGRRTGHRGPAGDGAGTGARLHHLSSGAQPQCLVRRRARPAPARAAGAGLRAGRADRGRPRRHPGAPPGVQNRGQGHLSRSGAVLPQPLRQGLRPALAQPDAAGSSALGRTGLGAAGPDGARPVRTLPSAARPAPQDPARLGPPDGCCRCGAGCPAGTSWR